MKISVIIPIYNVEEYLRQCLASVASQTMSDIEVICVNDCGSDNSRSILQEYAAENSRFIPLYHSDNSGLPAARNTGLKASKGQYVYFLDADDYLARDDALELLYNAACVDDADEVVGGVLKWHEYTGETYLDWHASYLGSEVHGQPLFSIPQLRGNVVAWNKLIRRELLLDNNILFDEKLLRYEDNPFSCKVHILAKSISIIPITTYMYRQARTGSITGNDKNQDIAFISQYCAEIFEFIESKERYHKFREIYYPIYIRQLINGAGILLRYSPSKSEKLDLMKEWGRVLSVLPYGVPGVSGELNDIVSCLQQGNLEVAWDKVVALNAVRTSFFPTQI